MLNTLDIGGEQARQFAEEIAMLKDALKAAPAVKDDCPKCGAGLDEREFTGKDFLGIEAVHMHYICKKCGSEIIEEFKLTHPFLFKSASEISVIGRLAATDRPLWQSP